MKLIETHIVPAGVSTLRLQEYLVSKFETIPTKSGIKKAIKREEILLDKRPANTGDWIQPGQIIELYQPEKPKKVFSLKLEVLYEDEYLALIKKPAGYPTSGNYFKTIENALGFNLKESSAKDAITPRPAHRLDNPTSGLLLIAKTGSVLRALNLQFEEKEIQKEYKAMVYGAISEEIFLQEPLDGKASKTLITPISFTKNEVGNVSLISAKPLTGRTHQIRRHLAGAGFPILGDKQYGNPISKKFKSLFLTATGLKFTHPETKEELKLELPLPKGFLKLLENKQAT